MSQSKMSQRKIPPLTRRQLAQGAGAIALGLGSGAGIGLGLGLGLGLGTFGRSNATETDQVSDNDIDNDIDWANLSQAEWKERLTPEQFRVLRKEGTERAGTSPLNEEKRKGTYVCAGCALPLFSSEHKYDSGTGWPSFFDVLPNAVRTKTDFKLIYPRTEYHCRRCGGHQGHRFKDGPKPTGLRYCNNGVALRFIPDAAEG